MTDDRALSPRCIALRSLAHQPVEQIASLRAMPNILLLRPADANETVEAWRVTLLHTAGPVGLVLTRQKLPVLDRTRLAPPNGTRGAHLLVDAKADATRR